MGVDDAGEARAGLGRNTDFIRLWASGATSGLGASITSLAYPLLALSVTTSARSAGLFALVALTVGALTRLPAGAVIDRVPLRRTLVVVDLVRVVTTAALVGRVLTGHLVLWHLLIAAGINACLAAVADVAHSVALRHVVAPSQLPQAFAVNEGRGHAVSLLGQPIGGLFYGITPILPLLADLASFGVSATLSSSLRHPMRPKTSESPRPRLRHDLLTGLRFIWAEPFVRTTLLAAAAFQLVFAGTTFALIASLTGSGSSPGSVGVLFAVAAVGGIAGAALAPALQKRLALKTMVVIMGWNAVVAFGALGWVHQPVLAGALMGSVYLFAVPANGALLSAQIDATPGHLQGRVMAACYLIGGLAAPLGAPVSGSLLDAHGAAFTFGTLALCASFVTVAVHLNTRMDKPARPDR